VCSGSYFIFPVAGKRALGVISFVVRHDYAALASSKGSLQAGPKHAAGGNQFRTAHNNEMRRAGVVLLFQYAFSLCFGFLIISGFGVTMVRDRHVAALSSVTDALSRGRIVGFDDRV
jgi:hypothetical protein